MNVHLFHDGNHHSKRMFDVVTFCDVTTMPFTELSGYNKYGLYHRRDLNMDTTYVNEMRLGEKWAPYAEVQMCFETSHATSFNTQNR